MPGRNLRTVEACYVRGDTHWPVLFVTGRAPEPSIDGVPVVVRYAVFFVVFLGLGHRVALFAAL